MTTAEEDSEIGMALNRVRKSAIKPLKLETKLKRCTAYLSLFFSSVRLLIVAPLIKSFAVRETGSI